jgi:SAM-dependent methyltransferase
MTLGAAICRAFKCGVPLASACRDDVSLRSLNVLEINHAGGLTSTLRLLPNHELRKFPEIDMQQMNYAADTLDMIVHSDTLEHVPDSRAALAECFRVLKPGGYLFYTVPVVIDRLTRSREGKAPSYHGNIESEATDLIVQREYGADFWCELFEVGFSNVTVTTLIFPASVAISAAKSASLP